MLFYTSLVCKTTYGLKKDQNQTMNDKIAHAKELVTNGNHTRHH